MPWFPVAAGRCPVGAEPDLGVPTMLCPCGAGTLLPGSAYGHPALSRATTTDPLGTGTAVRPAGSLPARPARPAAGGSGAHGATHPGPAPRHQQPPGGGGGPAPAPRQQQRHGGTQPERCARPARLLLPSGRLRGAMTSRGRRGYKYAMTSRAVSFGTARCEVRPGGGAGIARDHRDNPRSSAAHGPPAPRPRAGSPPQQGWVPPAPPAPHLAREGPGTAPSRQGPIEPGPAVAARGEALGRAGEERVGAPLTQGRGSLQRFSLSLAG